MQGTALSETGHAKARFLLTPMQSRFSDVSFVIQANCWKHLCDLADGFSVTFNSTTKQIANHDYQSTFLVRWQRRSHWLTKWSEILILSALQRLLSHLKKKKKKTIFYRQQQQYWGFQTAEVKPILTLKVPIMTGRRHFQNMFYIVFRGNNAWHYMWVVCWADHSHVMSSIIFSEKKKKKIDGPLLNNFPCHFKV